MAYKGGDSHLYRCFWGNPLVRTDAFGLWGTDVHRGRTFDWARAARYPFVAATRIAEANEATDGGDIGWGTGWAPIIGDQSYHFNRNLNPNGGIDTRIQHKIEHLRRAKAACDWVREKRDDPTTAAMNIGVALHALQDFYAHGDYGRTDTRSNGGIWIVHNSWSLQTPLEGRPDLSHYPDDPELDAVGGPGGRPARNAMLTRDVQQIGPDFVADYAIYVFGSQRITSTQAATTTVLSDFRVFISSNAGRSPPHGCCREFFGVP